MRGFLIFFFGGTLGLVAGVAIGIFVYPYIFLADVVADEKLTDASARKLVASGTFIHANPSDPVHYGKGGVKVYADALQLGTDFEVGPGSQVSTSTWCPTKPSRPTPRSKRPCTSISGRLRAFKGSQVFDIPPGTDPKRFNNVVIWCEHFGVLISPAKLAFRVTPAPIRRSARPCKGDCSACPLGALLRAGGSAT